MSHRIKVFPHNDLFNLAHYQREVINKKIADGVGDALSMDCMGCVISLAFTVEALVNFIGAYCIEGWKERQPYKGKIKQVCEVAGFEFVKENEPYRTIWKLKEIRDDIAHGKPLEFDVSVESREELRELMECSWDKCLSVEFVDQAYDAVKNFETTLFSKCEIPVCETLTAAIRLPVRGV